jgi:hypothetical protein
MRLEASGFNPSSNLQPRTSNGECIDRRRIENLWEAVWLMKAIRI